jgi:hypothetical protein
VGLYLLWRLLFRKTTFSLQAVTRGAAVALIGLLLFGGVRVVDNYVNDWQKGERIYEGREAFAKEMFKPSTPLEEKYVFLQLRDRGYSWQKVFKEMQWGERIFRTSFGEYGYTTVPGSFNYYDFVRLVSLALLVAVVCSIAVGCGIEGLALLTAAIGTSLLLMAVAFYHAWTVDFQAQGRYLLPIVAMAAMVLHHCRRSLGNVFCGFFAGLLYLTAICSFIFIGLAGIIKSGSPLL